jgi:hypothetical protein
MVCAHAIKPSVIFLLSYVTELWHIRGATLSGLELESVGHADVIDCGVKQFRVLGNCATYGNAPRASASNAQMCRGRISLINQVLSRCDHVVDCVLLVLFLPRLMPFLAEFTAASWMHESHHAAKFNAGGSSRIEVRILGNAVGAVSLVQGRM